MRHVLCIIYAIFIPFYVFTYEYDVFFYETFQEEETLLKKYISDDINAGFTSKTIQEYNSDIPAKIISVRTQSLIPDEWNNSIDAIITRSTGYDHLERYLKKNSSNIKCGYLPLYCNRSVAEQAAMLWFALLRKLPKQQKQFYTFSRDGLTGTQCLNKNLLVVGVGKIGYEICRIGKGLNMNVYGIDIVKDHPDIDYTDIKQGVKEADIIVCAMNLTENNYGYFNYELLKNAKRGTIFINISRGEISPSSFLLKLIEENHLGGVALDVFIEEPYLSTSLRNQGIISKEEVQATLALSKYDNVILTPHNAFNTHEATDNKAKQTITQLDFYIQNNKLLWPIPVLGLYYP